MTREELDEFMRNLNDPLQENALDRWRREARDQEERFAAERKAAVTLPQPDWTEIDARIQHAIAVERGRTIDFLADLIADARAMAADDLELATRSLTAELIDLKATLAELRLVLATDKTRQLDLPNPLSPPLQLMRSFSSSQARWPHRKPHRRPRARQVFYGRPNFTAPGMARNGLTSPDG
jgi:hypothetical protein